MMQNENLEKFQLKLNGHLEPQKIQNLLEELNLEFQNEILDKKYDEIISMITDMNAQDSVNYVNTTIHNLNNKKHQQNYINQVTFSRKQAFILLLMMYFGLFIRDDFDAGSFYLVNMDLIKRNKNKKLMCIHSYFKEYLQHYEKIQDDVITFQKISINLSIEQIQENTRQSESEFCSRIQFTNEKNEDQKMATIVDFADKNVGGLVLDSHNLAQEEILMLIYPEAIISMLFITPIQQNEAVLIENLIKYNNYKGYERSFEYVKKNFDENRINHMLVIDAKPFGSVREQLKPENIHRELLKCYAGFKLALNKEYQKQIPISTGKWGCGIFGGDCYLKTLIQFTGFCMASHENTCSENSLIINCFGDLSLNRFGQQFQLSVEKITIKKLLEVLDIIKEESKVYSPIDLNGLILKVVKTINGNPSKSYQCLQ